MSETIDKMLDLTADIADELLAIKDSEVQGIPDALKIKIISLVELASTVEAAPEEMKVAEEEVESAEFEEEADADSTVAEAVSAESIEPEAEPEVESEVESEVEPEVEPETEPEVEPETEPELEPEATPEEEPEAESVKIEEPVVDEVEESGEKQEEAAAAEAEEAAEAGEAAEAQVGSVPRLTVAQLIKSFSINDLFLFRREIFHGSKEAFDNSLAEIGCLGEDRRYLQYYLVENLDLNLNESPGKEFYESLLRFFK